MMKLIKLSSIISRTPRCFNEDSPFFRLITSRVKRADILRNFQCASVFAKDTYIEVNLFIILGTN